MKKFMVNKIEGNLETRETDISLLASQIFRQLTQLPIGVRKDEKLRTGLSIFCQVPGTRNHLTMRINEPGKNAQFFAVEKAVRMVTRDHYSSADDADERKCQYAGAIRIPISSLFEDGEDCDLVVSTSGIVPDEEVAISCIIASKLLGVPASRILQVLMTMAAPLPEGCFNKRHYLYHLIEAYSGLLYSEDEHQLQKQSSYWGLLFFSFLVMLFYGLVTCLVLSFALILCGYSL